MKFTVILPDATADETMSAIAQAVNDAGGTVEPVAPDPNMPSPGAVMQDQGAFGLRPPGMMQPPPGAPGPMPG